MENITVPKSKLLNTLRENREAHRAQYEEVARGYRESVILELEKRLQLARDGEINLAFAMPEPQDYTREYDVAISMLEWETSAEVELSAYDFKKYILNEWDWSRGFFATASRYVTS